LTGRAALASVAAFRKGSLRLGVDRLNMRLYSGKIGPIVDDLVRELTAQEDIEVEDVAEVRLDLEAVLKEYVRRERQMVDEAKDRMEREGLGYSKLGRMRQQLAKEMGFPQQDEVLPYLVDQLINMLFHSSNVVEIYADDVTIRKKMTPILRRHMEVETGLDAEVRSKIKNLQEGTSAFEVEYAKMMDQIKHKRGLE
jgi:hypothetical protein